VTSKPQNRDEAVTNYRYFGCVRTDTNAQSHSDRVEMTQEILATVLSVGVAAAGVRIKTNDESGADGGRSTSGLLLLY
jgi:hypothetical protein